MVTPSRFDLAAPAGGEIVAVANALCARAAHDESMGEIAIVARAANRDLRGVGSGTGAIRAAVSVAVAGGHNRMWAGVDGLDTIELSIQSLPEIVRTAAEASGFTRAYVGCVIDDTIAAVAVWFAVDDNVASPAQRTEAMQLLAAGAERQRDYLSAQAERQLAASVDSPSDDESEANERRFDADDPNLDAVTGLATKAEFEAALDEYESDEATLVVVDLDEFEAVGEQYGDHAENAVLREVADRLVSTCRRNDLIARLGDVSFAVLLTEASRAVGMQVAKRLLEAIAEPLPFSHGPKTVTATIALAHQFGLVDMEELVESADLAVASGKRAGCNRLVIAS